MNYSGNKNDSELSLQDILEKYYSPIWMNNFYLLFQSKSDADDVTQSVFLVLLEKWDSIDRTNVGAWLYGVARRKLYEFYRQKKIEGVTVFSAEILNAIIKQDDYFENDTYFKLSEEIILKIKSEILDSLSHDEIKLYNDYFVKGMSYEDIMKLYSLSYSAAASRVHRLKDKLNHLVGEKSSALLSLGITYTAFSLYLLMLMYNNR